MQNKKIQVLYLMNVSWNWIKQRPHYLAEELAKEYDVTVAHYQVWKKETNKNETDLRIKVLYRLPLEKKFKLIKIINTVLYKIQLFFLCRNKDILWLGSPDFASYIPENCLDHKFVVYDCMDDMVEFSTKEHERNFIFKSEEILFNHANVIFASSQNLRSKLISRYGNKDINVVNNAINKVGNTLVDDVDANIKKLFAKKTFTIIYIGTIASWFDFNLIECIHNFQPDIRICLFGPKEVEIPDNIGIEYCGICKHNQINYIMSKSDILIMPFILNELIMSVNPVKLYEYILSGKPCLAPRYPEAEQFSRFVHLYDNHSDCVSFIQDVMTSSYQQRPLSECQKFASENTWSSRGDKIKEKLRQKLSDKSSH